MLIETSLTPVYISLAVLASMFLLVFLLALGKTWDWGREGKKTEPPLKGLGLPEGSIRGLIAFLLVGGFLVFVFFGRPLLSTTVQEPLVVNEKVVMEPAGEGEPATPVMIQKPDSTLFTTVLTAFATLTGAVTGFYFGGRGSGGSTP